MEKANLNFSGKDNIIKSICWIFSVLGWLMYLICGWISLKWLDEGGDANNGYRLVMTIQRLSLTKLYGSSKKSGILYPLQMQTALLYIVIIVTMLFALFAFIVYMIKSTCKKDGAVFDGMMGDWTRLHSIPLFIAAGLFLIGICICDKNYNWKNYDHYWDDWEDANIAGIVLVILGLASLIFIYIQTNLPDDWLTASIKKGAYSTLIALEWYYFCYLMYNLAYIDHDGRPDKTVDDLKACGIAMPIIEGVVALVFAFFFKDVIIAFMNVLIFLGAAVYYLSLHEDLRKKWNGGHGVAEGIIDIVLMVLAIVVIILLIIMKKKECLK